MKSRSKRYKSSLEKKSAESFSVSDAIEILNNFEPAKFDESVEVSIALGVDPKQSSQAVRGTVNLPHGSGKKIKVLVFTDNPEEALAAGADYAGLEDLVKKVKDGWLDFDVALSSTSAMKEVRTIARVLGPVDSCLLQRQVLLLTTLLQLLLKSSRGVSNSKWTSLGQWQFLWVSVLLRPPN